MTEADKDTNADALKPKPKPAAPGLAGLRADCGLDTSRCGRASRPTNEVRLFVGQYETFLVGK